MAVPQSCAESPGPNSEPLHPSLGSPGDQLYYVPDNLAVPEMPVALKLEQACALVNHEQSEKQHSHQAVIVSVPPSVVHTIFAHRQWRSGMICADFVHSSIHTATGEAPLIDLAGKRVLELGAGTALPSIIASHAPSESAPAQIVITDYDERALTDQLRANLKANTHQGTTCKVNVQGYIWGTNPVDILDLLPCSRDEPEPKFDVIFLADCLWDPLSHDPLLHSVTQSLARTPSGRVYVIAGLHTGRGTIAAFIRRARQKGLCIVPWLRLCAKAGGPAAAEFSLCRAPRQTDSDAGAWAHILEAELASGVDVELDASATLSGPQVPSTVSWGRRLTGITRPFVSKELPEEAKEAGGVKERNKWILAWAMAWTDDVLSQ